jgi:hypothetical protein
MPCMAERMFSTELGCCILVPRELVVLMNFWSTILCVQVVLYHCTAFDPDGVYQYVCRSGLGVCLVHEAAGGRAASPRGAPPPAAGGPSCSTTGHRTVELGTFSVAQTKRATPLRTPEDRDTSRTTIPPDRRRRVAFA